YAACLADQIMQILAIELQLQLLAHGWPLLEGCDFGTYPRDVLDGVPVQVLDLEAVHVPNTAIRELDENGAGQIGSGAFAAAQALAGAGLGYDTLVVAHVHDPPFHVYHDITNLLRREVAPREN